MEVKVSDILLITTDHPNQASLCVGDLVLVNTPFDAGFWGIGVRTLATTHPSGFTYGIKAQWWLRPNEGYQIITLTLVEKAIYGV